MNITYELEKFISQKTNNGALLVTGKWGCGKTYLLNQIAKDKNNEEEYLIVVISLFGIDSIENLHRTVKENIAFHKGFSSKSNTAKRLFGKFGRITSPVALALSDSSRIAKGFNAVLNVHWSDFITVKKDVDCFVNGKKCSKRLVLIFDDFERSKIDRIDLMGAINDYSEGKDIKVIVVANEEEIKENEYNNTKEKLISRTVHMSLDNEHIVNNIINSYIETEKGYKDFLHKHCSVIRQVFADSQSENIRSLKSVLMDFERVYGAWKSTDIPIDGNIEDILYQFAAIEFEYKAGNYINASISYILHVDGDADSRNKIESKYTPDTFTSFLTSLSSWIVDGEWDEEYFVDEIKKKYIKDNISPEQRFLCWNFWDLQQEDIDIGMPIVLEKAYNGKASCDELISLLQKIHAMNVHEIPLPYEADYKKIEDGFEKRKKEIKYGTITEPQRYTFSEKSQLDSEAYKLYDKIEFLDSQIIAWNNRNKFISYLNGENGVSDYDLKNKYIDSFDDNLLKLFIKKYIEAQNRQKRKLGWVVNGLCFNDATCSTTDDFQVTVCNFKALVAEIKTTITPTSDKMTNAISNSLIELLNNKIDQLSNLLQQ